MRSYPIGEQDVSGTYARVMSGSELKSMESSGILGDGRTDYVPTFPITDVSALGRSPREIRERSKSIGIRSPEYVAVFYVSGARAVYGPRQRIGGREIKLKAGTPVKLLDKTRCR